MEITLDLLLESRDKRSAMQKDLILKNPGKTLICFTVVMPGRVKRNHLSVQIAKAAKQAIQERFHADIVQFVEHDFVTGYESFWVVSIPTIETKKAVCEIEESHPLGRLFDIDVIDSAGIPVSRADAQKLPRKCLLCDNDARVCMRNKTHAQSELMECVNQMVEQYVRRI